MSKSTVRQCAVPVTSVAMAAGLLLIGSPASAAPTTTSFKNACQASAVLTVHKVADTSMTVDAPASVTAGETFTYRIQPGGGSYPNSDSGATTTNISRLKVDYEIPANATFVSAAVVAGTGVNLDGVAPSVTRINDSGNPDGGGNLLRLSGNNEVIGNSPSSSTNSQGGIRAPKLKKNLDGSTNGNGDSWFRLPAIDVTVVAGSGGVITPKVRTAGSAGTYNANENYYTFLPLASFFGNQWAPTRCTPRDAQGSALNAGAGPLATINVGAAAADTTTTLNVPGTAKTGTAVDLTATVAPAGATGTVQFKDGANNIGNAVPVNNGTATLNHTFTSDGAHAITAVYSGDAANKPSTSAAATVTVSTDPVIVDTTTTLNVPATAKTGTAVDLTATVAPAGATGTVQFKDGADNIGNAVPVDNGTATLSHTFTSDGAHAITAVYSGDAGNKPSTSAAATVTVTTDPVIVDTTTTLNVPATAKTGTAVDLTATVAPVGATGTVQFKDGADNIGNAVPVNNGTATLNHIFTTTGAHAITAAYSGDATNKPSTSAASNVDVSVNAMDTTTTLNVPATAKTGTAVDLTATIAPAPSGGTVQFKDGDTNIGGPITLNGATATLNHTFTTDGAHPVTAVYSGADGFNTSTSTASTVQVSTDPVIVDTVTTINVPGEAKTGDSVDLWALVKDNEGNNAAGGTVQFKDGGTNIGGPIGLVDGGAKLVHTFTTTGAHSISAVYSGDGNFNGSTGQAQTVNVTDPAPVEVATVTTLTAPGTATKGMPVDLSAAVKTESGEAVTSGTVTFMDGNTAIGEAVDVVNGQATLSYKFTQTGDRQIKAVYSGATGFKESTSSASTVKVSGGGNPGGTGSLGSLGSIFGS
ncbi:beta strand repeat-containing protein [Rhodococcus sp. UNC363MFTsu5.1]|uniref:beta strand repeat-containing protein n=1 Tax=Rhodococcus sp. UNC363MFTsu5.1 TaxID=1449069 RepID=UPI000691EBF6|nr:Ig-like domain-containing protein [Rhodococcus sp. UNC363MFTsu5.1]